jgi:integral membrane sensor domain MASE1
MRLLGIICAWLWLGLIYQAQKTMPVWDPNALLLVFGPPICWALIQRAVRWRLNFYYRRGF